MQIFILNKGLLLSKYSTDEGDRLTQCSLQKRSISPRKNSSQIGKLRSQYQQQHAPMEATVRKALEEWWVAADENFVSSVSTEPDAPQAAQLSIGAGSETPAEWQSRIRVSRMAAVQQHLQGQFKELNERLTEMQSVQSDSDYSCPEPPLSNTKLSV